MFEQLIAGCVFVTHTTRPEVSFHQLVAINGLSCNTVDDVLFVTSTHVEDHLSASSDQSQTQAGKATIQTRFVCILENNILAKRAGLLDVHDNNAIYTIKQNI